jgi:AraC-like DNA-binding protein
MQKAKELLENTFLSVKEATVSVGINDESHFVRDFKMNFGLTPSQYRQRYRASLSTPPDLTEE